MITCPIDGKTPKSVSLTLNPCDYAENNLKIIDNQPPDGVKKEFGVCVKQLTYPNRDFIIRFIEWVHMLQILGNSKVHVFIRFLHPEMMKIIKHLEMEDSIEVFKFLEPSGISNDILNQSSSYVLEAAMLNDCFYRVRHLYKYVSFMDPDEVIIPLNESHHTWHDLIESQPFGADIYAGMMITFPPNADEPFKEIPKYNYMLQNIKVSQHRSVY